MKFTSHLNASGQAYWLVEIRFGERLLLAEGRSFSEAVHNAIELVTNSSKVSLSCLGTANA